MCCPLSHMRACVAGQRGNGVTGQRGNGRQVAVIADPEILQPGRRPVAFGSGHDWAERHGTGCILSPIVFAYRKAEGGDRDGTKALR